MVKSKKIQKPQPDFQALLRHKLKGPATTIHLYAEALLAGQAGRISKAQKDYLQEIHKASKKMIAFINKIK